MAVSGRSVIPVMPTNDVDADVKSCGPGLPLLRPSPAMLFNGHPGDGGKNAGPRGDHV